MIIVVIVFAIYAVSAISVFIAARKGRIKNDNKRQ